jgi:hypothetical protein
VSNALLWTLLFAEQNGWKREKLNLKMTIEGANDFYSQVTKKEKEVFDLI